MLVTMMTILYGNWTAPGRKRRMCFQPVWKVSISKNTISKIGSTQTIQISSTRDIPCYWTIHEIMILTDNVPKIIVKVSERFRFQRTPFRLETIQISNTKDLLLCNICFAAHEIMSDSVPKIRVNKVSKRFIFFKEHHFKDCIGWKLQISSACSITRKISCFLSIYLFKKTWDPDISWYCQTIFSKF